MSDHKDVLEQNVTTLLETGGEPPRLSDAARARIRDALLAQHAVAAPSVGVTWRKRPLVAATVGLAAAAAIALIALHLVGDTPTPADRDSTLADGSTYVTAPAAKVIALGARHVRVEGAALLDVVPGKGQFVVDTARGRIEVMGTKFLVDAAADRTTTAVVRGEVRLVTDRGEVVLHAGEQGVAELGRPPVRGPAPRLSHLASWAREARRLDDAAVHHGTLFARDPGVRSHPPWGEEYPLPIARLALDVIVEDQVARVALDQTFHNVADQDLEGVYRFAIPPDAALQRLAMYVDGKLEESAVVERMRARRIYEELVYRRVDPALLEWAGTGRLALRVYPIPARQDKRIVLAYTQSLAKLYDDWTLTVPLPEVDQPVGEVDVALRVKGCAACELTSPSHQIVVTRDGDDAILRYRSAGERIGDSFVVHVRDRRTQTTIATKTDGDDRYVMVRAPVELGGGAGPYRPHTWVVLDDVSASRGALELRAQTDIIDALCRELDEHDKIAVIAFDVQARQKLAPTRVIDVDRKALRAVLATEGGVGATDFSVALDAATQALAGTHPDDAMIIYLGDGTITAGPRALDTLRAQIADKAHFIGVGVGDGPDTQTLGALAAATGGYATTIDLADDVGWRAFDLVAALHTRRVTNLAATLVAADGAPVAATTYLGSPQLADGEQLELIGKLASAGTPAAVELSGAVDGAPWHHSIVLGGATHGDAGYLPRLWAQRHIAARLLAKHEPVAVPPCARGTCPTEAELREQRDEAIRKEVVALGKRYFLLSRHTSLLVLENDAMYARYGVAKGAGDTWAPYALPPTIPVVKPAIAATPVIPSDAVIVRAPLQVFFENVNVWGSIRRRGLDENDPLHTSDVETGGFGVGWDRGDGGGSVLHDEVTRASRGEPEQEKRDGFYDENRQGDDGKSTFALRLQTQPAATDLTLGHDWDDTEFGVAGNKGGKAIDGRYAGAANLALVHFAYASDPAFDDVSAFVPALVEGPDDAWRGRLAIAAKASEHQLDLAARAVLAEARRRLPVGIYRWDDLELAIDGARRIGWRRTTDAGLGETASYDGATWTRRYAELGLDVTRPVADDDVALAFAYLPVWIADPAHYARWYDVTSAGPRAVALSTRIAGTAHLAFVLRFDDQFRLISISDGNGATLLAVTWGPLGPSAARVHGHDVPVAFTADAIADAPAWAHGATQPGVVVELPERAPAHWQAKAAAAAPGGVPWRDAERQLLASFAAAGDRQALLSTYDELRTHGGVELGDLVLASGGVGVASTDAQLATALAPLSREPLARYLIAARAHGKAPRSSGLVPQTTQGFVGALWSLRAIAAELEVGHGKAAVDALVAMGDRAFALRQIAAAAVNPHWEVSPADVARAWDTVAVGAYTNIARTRAAQALFVRGQVDAGADRVVALVGQLDLHALPPDLSVAQARFPSSRRGDAGWELVWATWRDRVLAGDSYDHVMALVPAAMQTERDLPRVLERAATLAGDDVARRVVVARLAVDANQNAAAHGIIDPLLARAHSRELDQLAATLALREGRTAVALDDLEQAQAHGGDEAVGIAVVRSELAQIISVARLVASETSGAQRQHAIDRALAWGARWRAVDPGNTAIDAQLGELMLTVGDGAGAWRQLSSAIERDPWSGAGYALVANAFERQGKVADALPFWQQAIVIDQTDPTPRLRKAQALIALGRSAEGDALLHEIAGRKWHDMWSGVVDQAQSLLERGQH